VLGDETFQDIHAFGCAQIERDAALAAVDDFRPQRNTVLVRRQGADRIAASRQFDLQYIRTEVGEQAGRQRSGDDRRDVEYTEVLERAGTGAAGVVGVGHARGPSECARKREGAAALPPPRPAKVLWVGVI